MDNMPRAHQPFTIAALICGILSITLGCCGLSIPFGALSILFICLSRSKGQRLDGLASAALVFSLLGILYGIYIYYRIYVQLTDPAYEEQMNAIFRQLYGMDMQEFINQYSTVNVLFKLH